MTDQNKIAEVEDWKNKLPKMTQVELGSLWRFAPIGHVVFCNPELYEIFQKHFGGFTPSISKAIGLV